MPRFRPLVALYFLAPVHFLMHIIHASRAACCSIPPSIAWQVRMSA